MTKRPRFLIIAILLTFLDLAVVEGQRANDDTGREKPSGALPCSGQSTCSRFLVEGLSARETEHSTVRVLGSAVNAMSHCFLCV